jgi:hypothetical protein
MELNIKLDDAELVVTLYKEGEQYNLYCFGKIILVYRVIRLCLP